MIVRKKKQKQLKKKKRKKERKIKAVWQTQKIKNKKFVYLFLKKCSKQKTSKSSKKFQDEKKKTKKWKKVGKTESKLHIEYSNRNKPSEEKAEEDIEQEVLES